MSDAAVTREGLDGIRPGREAPAAYGTRRRGRRGAGGEQPMVPAAEFGSYYGKPVLNKPVWSSPDIPGYLYLGGLAGGASLLAAVAELTRRPDLARVSKVGSSAAGLLSILALVHDLGRPKRFLHMLRVFKVTSPMSVGSWALGAYVPAASVAALSDVTGRARPVGLAATAVSAAMAPFVASYTAALISDTAVPAWHDGYREMPFLFVGSGAMAAGGLGVAAAPLAQHRPARNVALFGTATELVATELMKKRLGMVAEPYQKGMSGRLMRAGQLLAAAGVAAALWPQRSRRLGMAAGASMMLSSAITRFGIFKAGMVSSEDPKYTVVPQRERATD